MFKYLECTGKGPGDRPLVLLWFLVLDLKLRLKVRYLKIELKFIVGCLLCGMIAWLPCTGNGSVKIRTVVT